MRPRVLMRHPWSKKCLLHEILNSYQINHEATNSVLGKCKRQLHNQKNNKQKDFSH